MGRAHTLSAGRLHQVLTKVEINLTETTARLMEQLMGNSNLRKLLSLDRKTLAKLPDLNDPRQLELFVEFMS